MILLLRKDFTTMQWFCYWVLVYYHLATLVRPNEFTTMKWFYCHVIISLPDNDFTTKK